MKSMVAHTVNGAVVERISPKRKKLEPSHPHPSSAARPIKVDSIHSF